MQVYIDVSLDSQGTKSAMSFNSLINCFTLSIGVRGRDSIVIFHIVSLVAAVVGIVLVF